MLQQILLVVPVLLFSVIAHEVAHGYAALKQGDDTALMLGRLTWNPVKHIDPFMTILLPVMLALAHAPILGGAKPVPVNPRNYRNFKRGDIIVSLAGVFVNAILVFVFAALIALIGLVGQHVNPLESSLGILQSMMIIGVQLNLVLILFNLIPIPPLDGSHVMKYLLPLKLAVKYSQFGRYGIILLIAAMWFAPNLLGYWLLPATKASRAILETVSPVILPTARRMLSQ